MAFDTQIQDLVGTSFTDQTAMDQWAADACKEIINRLPRDLKMKCATRSTLNASTTTLDLDSKGAILHATRLSADSGGYEKACRRIDGRYGDLTNDSNDLHYYATATDPVYFITNNSSGNPTLFVRPNPTNAQPSYIHHISYPTVDVSADSTIANFPDEAEYLVVLYTSMKALHQQMNSKQSDLPSLALPPAPTSPTLSTTAVSFSQAAPTFTKPAVALDFAQVNTYIDTNEDVELSSAKLQEISAQLNEFNSNINNEQTEFNKENVEYQAQLQISLANAQFDNQEDARKLQKFQTEVSTYQAEVNSKVQEFTQNLQKHSTDYQWLVAQYGQLKSDYSQGLQALSGVRPAQKGK